MTPRFAFAAFAVALMFTVASALPLSAQAAEKEYTIIKLGNEEIKNSEVQNAWRTFFPDGGGPDFETMDEKVRQSVIREVINKRLVFNQAQKEGIDKTPDFQENLEQMKRQLMIQTYVENKTKGLVDEAKVKSAYDKKVMEMKDKQEVRARHILVKSEDEAQDLLKQIRGGADFDKLAKDKSIDKATAVNGGDLGYFTQDKMVPSFGNAAFNLKAGEVSEPVKSEFGWHVIKQVDKRKVSIPAYAEMKDLLREDIINEQLNAMLKELMDKTTIAYFGPDGKEKPFAKDPKAAKDSDVAKTDNQTSDTAPAAGKEEKNEKKEDVKPEEKKDALKKEEVKKEESKSDPADEGSAPDAKPE